ncbi:hypothetical protein A2U01_0090099, partial [Trifolium medium]|nr:hypothetical protein [Trifolium medium]
TVLREFEQSLTWVIVIAWCETGFECLEKIVPGGDESITEHPLVPAQRCAVHVERGD